MNESDLQLHSQISSSWAYGGVRVGGRAVRSLLLTSRQRPGLAFVLSQTIYNRAAQSCFLFRNNGRWMSLDVGRRRTAGVILAEQKKREKARQGGKDSWPCATLPPGKAFHRWDTGQELRVANGDPWI